MDDVWVKQKILTKILDRSVCLHNDKCIDEINMNNHEKWRTNDMQVPTYNLYYCLRFCI